MYKFIHFHTKLLKQGAVPKEVYSLNFPQILPTFFISFTSLSLSLISHKHALYISFTSNFLVASQNSKYSKSTYTYKNPILNNHPLLQHFLFFFLLWQFFLQLSQDSPNRIPDHENSLEAMETLVAIITWITNYHQHSNRYNKIILRTTSSTNPSKKHPPSGSPPMETPKTMMERWRRNGFVGGWPISTRFDDKGVQC